MKRILFSLIFIILGTPMFSQHMEIEGYELPNNSIEFLRDNYNSYSKYGTPMFYVEYDDNRNSRVDEFEVHFANGTVIEFDRDGNLKSIDCGNDDIVPLSIIPSNIKNALRRYTRNFNIVEYSIDRGRLTIDYEIELNNGIEYKFNKNGKLKE